MFGGSEPAEYAVTIFLSVCLYLSIGAGIGAWAWQSGQTPYRDQMAPNPVWVGVGVMFWPLILLFSVAEELASRRR